MYDPGLSEKLEGKDVCNIHVERNPWLWDVFAFSVERGVKHESMQKGIFCEECDCRYIFHEYENYWGAPVAMERVSCPAAGDPEDSACPRCVEYADLEQRCLMLGEIREMLSVLPRELFGRFDDLPFCNAEKRK